MIYEFSCSGHKNILGTHKTTFEFTKAKELTRNGDCIVGVGSDFELSKLKAFLKFDKIKITLSITDKNNKNRNKDKNNNRIQPLSETTKEQITDTITCNINPDFDDNKEIVIRLGQYKDRRTLATNADKAAIHLNRHLITKLKDDKVRMKVEIESIKSTTKCYI